MSIRFAAPASAIRARTRPSTGALAYPVAVNDNRNVITNDNGDDDREPNVVPDETALGAALRYFAKHGLAAARKAHEHASDARTAGNKESFMRWRDICRALDRRLARSLDSSDPAHLTR